MSDKLRLAALKLHQLMTGRRVWERLQELNRSQWLDKEGLRLIQQDKLCQIAEYAYRYVPYYRRIFDQAGFRPEELRADPGNLMKIPVLTKALIRENFDDLTTTDPLLKKKLTRSKTSGSTGTPMIYLLDDAFRDFATADIQRHLGWAGWSLGQRHAYIWGAKFETKTQEKFRTRALDWVWNRFLINAFTMNEASLAVFAERVHKERPKIIFGYAWCLHRFAHFIRQSPYQGITFNGIFSSAEVLLPSVREFIEETFQCRVFNRYGSRELGGLACECSAHTGLHISSENNYIEIIKDGRPAKPGEIGDIVVTNLNNRGMPFIRFLNEDAGSWREEQDCPCGRAFPMMETLQGRIIDSFQTADGQAVYAGYGAHVFPTLADLSIKQYQIIQKSLDLIIFRLVTVHDVPQFVLDDFVRIVHGIFGDKVQVKFEFPEEIPVLPSGKHQYIISEMNKGAG